MSTLSDSQKRELNRHRIAAVKSAWKQEQELVKQKMGTREWNKKQQEEILFRGKVKGYDGHHMKSVSAHPEHAGDPKNIQLLSESEHLQAHKNDFRNQTNGYYNTKTKQMEQFKNNEIRKVPIISLSNNQQLKNAQKKHMEEKLGRYIC